MTGFLKITIGSALLLCCFVLAVPEGLADERIQTFTYNYAEVVPIYTQAGNPTLIQFEEDESVVDTNKGMLGMGDAKAWSVGAKGNNVLMKPVGSDADTKLIIVTTKRTYAFDIKKASKNTPPTLIVRFDYPDTKEKVARLAIKKQEAINEKLEKLSTKNEIAMDSKNSNYMKRGDASLAPSFVYDDGRFTYMRFDSSRELPLVYKLLPDGSEALTNSHMESASGTVVIHETAENFVLRYGTAMMAIRNNGFSPDGKLNVLGTTVPSAIRLKKEEL